MSTTFEILLNLPDDIWDVFNVTESISILGRKIWDIVHSELNQLETAIKRNQEMETR